MLNESELINYIRQNVQMGIDGIKIVIDDVKSKEFYDELLDKSEETIEYFKRFEELFNRSFWDVYSNEREEFDSYVRSGFAVSDDEHIALTLDGIDISNRIMAIFV